MESNAPSDNLFLATDFPVAEWDRILSAGELRRLRPSDKRKRFEAALERKIAVLEHAALSHANLAAEIFIPRNRKELREWIDPARGLWSWTDVKLDNPFSKQNGEKLRAFPEALRRIDELKKNRNSTLRRRIRDRDATIERLEMRIAALMQENRRLYKMLKTESSYE